MFPAQVSCVPKPQKMCDFQRLQGKILKTVDSVYQDVETTEECQQRQVGAHMRPRISSTNYVENFIL